jgi:uncharacterized protein YjiS (DUF1127 family)
MTTMTGATARHAAFFDHVPFGDAVAETLRAWREASTRRTALRRTRLELEALSDRELDDLGIARWDIPAVSRRAVYGL